jgi:hypothetical protein
MNDEEISELVTLEAALPIFDAPMPWIVRLVRNHLASAISPPPEGTQAYAQLMQSCKRGRDVVLGSGLLSMQRVQVRCCEDG